MLKTKSINIYCQIMKRELFHGTLLIRGKHIEQHLKQEKNKSVWPLLSDPLHRLNKPLHLVSRLVP